MLENFSSNENQHLDPYLSVSLRKGDVLQVMSRDAKYLQVAFNNLQRIGIICLFRHVRSMICPEPVSFRHH